MGTNCPVKVRKSDMTNRVVMLSIITASLSLYGCDRVRSLVSGGATESKALLKSVVQAERKSVSALGRLEPASRVVNIGTSLPDRVAKLFVTEGGTVELDADLVHLEGRDERLAEQERIAAELRSAQKKLAAEQQYHSALIEEARIREREIETLRPLQIDVQEANQRSLKAELETAQKNLQRQQSLTAANSSSEQELDRDRLAVRVAEEKLKSASKELDRLKAGWVLDREVAKAAVKSAEAASARALAGVPVDELEKQLQHAKSRVAQTVLKAPFAGQVLKVIKRPGEVSNGGAILQLANTSEMHAVAEVYESEIRLVRIGQKATISSPALERELTGRVVEIGVQIYKNDVLDVDPASDTDTRVVEVRILLDDSKAAAALTHLQVDVTIGLEASGGDRTAAFDRFAK